MDKEKDKWDRRKIWIAPFLTLIVIGIALFNVWLTSQANRPDLVPTNALMYLNSSVPIPAVATIGWTNIGKRSALRGTATLFTVSNDGRRYQKFGLSEITNGVNTTLSPVFAPGSQGSVQIAVDMSKFQGLFLACIKYYDDTNKSYKQKLLFRPSDNSFRDHIVIRLDELPSNHQNCPRA